MPAICWSSYLAGLVMKGDCYCLMFNASNFVFVRQSAREVNVFHPIISTTVDRTARSRFNVVCCLIICHKNLWQAWNSYLAWDIDTIYDHVKRGHNYYYGVE